MMATNSLQALLGDFSVNGLIDPIYGTEQAIGAYPFLLISSGPDGTFGPSGLAAGGSTANWNTNKMLLASATTSRTSPMSGRRGFTLIELLTSIAVLVIVFGLMISLSNFVRNTSATDLNDLAAAEDRRPVVSIFATVRRANAGRAPLLIRRRIRRKWRW